MRVRQGEDEVDVKKQGEKATVEQRANPKQLKSVASRRSAVARAEASERFFVWRLAAITAIAVAIGWLGIHKVSARCAGVRTAYELARMHDTLRGQVELNRRYAARLSGMKDVNRLREEAVKSFQMRIPRRRDLREVER